MLISKSTIQQNTNIKFGTKALVSDVLSYKSNPILKNNLKNDIFQKQTNDPERKTLSYNSIPFTGKINRYEQGEQIATNIKNILGKHIGGVSTKQFQAEFVKIDDKNIIPTIKAYNKISPNETLIGAICQERADLPKTRISTTKNILDRLVKIGNEAGVQTEHYSSRFNEELNSQFDKIMPVKVKQLDKISGALVQAIENKNSLLPEEREQLKKADKKHTQSYTTQILNGSVKQAEQSMQEQANYDGWAAKLGEQIRKIWNSENQKELVHEDIDKFQSQVDELNKTVGTDKFNNKFKEIFNVEYDPELIATYQQKEEKYIAASLCTAIENNFNESVSDLVNKRPLQTKFYPMTGTGTRPLIEETREEMYNRNFKAFAEFLGKGNVENGKKQLTQTMKDYKITEKSSLDEKYEVLQKMANRYSRRLNMNTKRATGKQTLREIKNAYDNSYYAAFGVDNDIAKRVEDYRNSQMFSEAVIKDSILGVASAAFWSMTAGTGFIPTLKLAGMHAGINLAVNGSDRVTSKNGVTDQDKKNLIKLATLDGIVAIANQLSYKGIDALVSPIAKMSGSTAKITNIALSAASDIGIDCATEYVATGKVTLRGTVFSVIFTASGQLLNVKLEPDVDYHHKRPRSL